jgi:hypothetical protein
VQEGGVGPADPVGQIFIEFLRDPPANVVGLEAAKLSHNLQIILNILTKKGKWRYPQ